MEDGQTFANTPLIGLLAPAATAALAMQGMRRICETTLAGVFVQIVFECRCSHEPITTDTGIATMK